MKKNHQFVKGSKMNHLLRIVSCMTIISISSNSFADDMKRDVETFNQKYGGVNAALFGKVYPSGILSEIRKGTLTLRKARVSLRNMLKRAEKAGEIPDYAKNLSGRLDALSDDFNYAVKELKSADSIQTKRLNEITSELIFLEEDFEETKDRLIEQIKNKKEKDEGWSANVSTYGSIEYATSKEDLMPIGGIGLNLKWRKEKLAMDLLLGAGVSSIDGAAVSWTFIPSLQFVMSSKLSLGPAMVLTQDLGSMEGANRLVWEIGCKVHTNLFGLGFWALPTIGIHGKRGHGAGSPTYSPNIGVTFGIDLPIIN